MVIVVNAKELYSKHKKDYISILRVILPYFLALGISLFLIRFITGFVNNQRDAQSLNVILISIDTLRADHMGVYGYNKNTTPHIDQWAKKAYVFTNALTVVPNTYASFVALMTGKHPFTTKKIRAVDPPLSLDTPTLVKILRSRSYYSAAFVNSGWIGPSTNLNAGFDEQYFLDWNEYKDVKGTATITRQAYEANVNASIDWLEKNKDRKFFLWIHLMDPHAPYNPPDDLKCIHNQAYCENIRQKIPKELEDQRSLFEGWKNGCGTSQSLSPDTIELYKTLYDGEITYADILVKKILDTVQRTGLDKKSIVILYGDHGEGFDHSYYFDHGLLYQSNVQIPLIVYLPTLRFGKKVNDLVDNTDIVPTLLDILGVSKTNDTFDGISFRRVFHNAGFGKPGPSVKRSYVYAVDTQASRYGVFDGRYKYIFFLKPDTTCLYRGQMEELYDIVNDPQEENNIISQYPDIGRKLKSLLMEKIMVNNMTSYEEQKRNDTETLERLKSFGY